MRHFTRFFLACSLLLGPAVGAAAAADIRDLLLLKDAGLTDDVLIDLIQSDGSVFQLKAADIIDLHNKGLSDRVIRAMLATARKPGSTADQMQPPSPDIPLPDAPMEDRARVTIPVADEAPQAMAPPPIDVQPATEPVKPRPARREVVQEVVQVPVPVPIVIVERPLPPPPPPPPPVYWGYGGQKRPGSWDEPGAPPPAPPPAPAKPAPPKGGRGGH